MKLNKLYFPSSKVDVNIQAHSQNGYSIDLGKIIPCIDGQFLIQSKYFKMPMMEYFNTLSEAKEACQIYFEEWINGFTLRESNINQLLKK